MRVERIALGLPSASQMSEKENKLAANMPEGTPQGRNEKGRQTEERRKTKEALTKEDRDRAYVGPRELRRVVSHRKPDKSARTV